MTVQPASGDWSETGQLRVGDAARPLGAPRERCVTVLHHPRSAPLVRRQLAADLAERGSWLGDELRHDAAWVATELVGNAVSHACPLAGGVITVSWRPYPRGLHLGVTDGGAPQAPQLRRVGPESAGGRGLAIVEALSAHWGVSRTQWGRCVWAWLGEVSRAAS